jgi:FlaA1/EpsC-like NDP-sugar epimerase
MLGKRRPAWVLRLLVGDSLTLLLSFLLAYGLRVLLNQPLDRAVAPLARYLWLLALIVPVWVGLLAAHGAYRVRWTRRSHAGLALSVSAIGLILLTAGVFLVKESEVNRSVLALFAAVSALGLWVERGLVHSWLSHAEHGDRGVRVALVVGTGERATRVIAALRQYPEAGWVVRGRVSLDPAEAGGPGDEVPVIGAVPNLEEILHGEQVVDEVFFADRYPGAAGKKIILIETWNEYGEGAVIEPHREWGFGYLDAIRAVFGHERGPHQDVSPENLCLPVPSAY